MGPRLEVFGVGLIASLSTLLAVTLYVNWTRPEEEMQDDDGYVHRGITCNSCQVSPIRGVRYKCSNCVDYDLCENCESQNRHQKAHIFLKIRIPIPPLANPRTALLPVFYPGGKNEVTALSWETLRQLQKETHFDQVELEALFEQYKSLSTSEAPEGGIDKETFEHCLGPLGVEKNLVTERIFMFFDKNGDGLIDFEEMVRGMSVLCKGSSTEKLKHSPQLFVPSRPPPPTTTKRGRRKNTFKGLDLDGNHFISKDELRRMHKAYFYLSMELVNDVIRGLEEEMSDGGFDEDDDQYRFLALDDRPDTNAEAELADPSEDYESQFGTFGAGPTAGTTQSNGGHTSFTSSHATRRQSMQYAPSSASGYGNDNINNINTLANGIRRRSSSVVARSLSIPDKTDQWPAMEAMSQDAINEMVDTAFRCADTDNDGLISFEEFKKWATTDTTMIAWFEALGSVF